MTFPLLASSSFAERPFGIFSFVPPALLQDVAYTCCRSIPSPSKLVLTETVVSDENQGQIHSTLRPVPHPTATRYHQPHMPAEPTGELQTILTGAAYAALNDRAFLRITGSDATRWLNGMVTNSVQALQPGEGNYNFLLNAQGRIQGDCTIYRDPDANKDPAYILETDESQIDTIQQLLDKFIIMDDVELTRIVHEQDGLLLLGPTAQTILSAVTARLDMPASTDLGPLRITPHHGAAGQLTTPAPGIVPQYLLYADIEFHELTALVATEAAIQVSPAALEQLRVLEARPRYGTDIRNTETAKDLPQETNQPHALHFNKGCYVGQEIVERIRSRGQVHRLFTPFRLEGTLPTALPAPLEANGKPAGELTSATTVSTTEGDVHLALGYVRREFLDTKAPLTYAGGTAHPRSPGSLG